MIESARIWSETLGTCLVISAEPVNKKVYSIPQRMYCAYVAAKVAWKATHDTRSES